ncbi:MAG: sugar transferase [Phascolarctobacterium sp.]|nr:sugar transferase [Phascolarctobacterium sp.]
MYEKYFKRILDVILSGIALTFLSPVYLVLYILVRTKLGSPVFFTQERPGLNGKIFKIYKFRTMTDERDENGNLLSDEQRLTDFGKALRSTSLDELPEIWNIFIGDMSIVGPRPLLVRDMVFFDDNVMRRQSVMPGLTGLAQICGRNNISWEEKFKYDLYYIQKISFWEDLRIIFRTFLKVVGCEDINTEGMATAEDYGDYLLRMNIIDLKTYDEKQKQALEILKAGHQRV